MFSSKILTLFFYKYMLVNNKFQQNTTNNNLYNLFKEHNLIKEHKISEIFQLVYDKNTQKSIEILGQALLLGRETLQNTTEDYGMFVSALMSMKMAADENITLMNKLNRVLSDIVNTGSESGEIITKSRYTINLNKD